VQIYHHDLLVASHVQRRKPNKTTSVPRQGRRTARPASAGIVVTHMVDRSARLSFAGTMYHAGRAWRGEEVEVCIVAEAVQMNYQGRIVRTQPIRHDWTKEHGAYATDGQRVGGEAHAELVARWLDDGLTPNGAYGRAFGKHRCARLRPDILRAQERLASPGAAHR
jgi:hypothetical protein